MATPMEEVERALAAGIPSDQTLLEAVKSYYVMDPWPATKAETLSLIKRLPESLDEIKKRFGSRLEFGTAGLRGPMGCGFNRMNDLVVMQTTQGLCDWLLRHSGTSKPVCIGFDGRHGSRRYANVAAAVFISKGIRVFLGSRVTATPMNPYCVVKKSCGLGIQVTASHNPKDDNGYKVYQSNGAQIVPPTDAEMTEAILKNLKPWPGVLELLDASSGFLKDSQKAEDIYDELFASYMEEITADLCLNVEGSANARNAPLKIVYTAMHGVGYPFVAEILSRFGYGLENLAVVEEQKNPDPEFSTVAFPNPEEKGALNLAQALADKVGAKMIIANDPDADRFAAAEKRSDGSWKVFHGDELGIIFGAYGFELALKKGIKPEKMAFICSAVSSRMLEKMARTEGAYFEETMTGFKWMMNAAIPLQEKGLTPVLVYEEALGYALDMRVPDKDGVSASAVWVQMVSKMYNEGQTVEGFLDSLRRKYGYFVTNNSYFLCYDKEAIGSLFAEFRNGGQYVKQIGKFKVERIRDVTTGYDNGEKDRKCKFPLTPSSQMVTIFFENSAVITLRTSGTEPKLKWYSELSASDPEVARAELQQVVDAVIENVLQPTKYPLEPPKTK